jgi:hypothetical protein
MGRLRSPRFVRELGLLKPDLAVKRQVNQVRVEDGGAERDVVFFPETIGTRIYARNVES